MIHYSCDRCKRPLEPHQEPRYVVRIESQPVLEPPGFDDPTDDRDHLDEMDELLSATDLDEYDADQDLYRQQRFDLCQECYRKFLRNPLGAEPVAHWGTSDN